MFPSLSRRLLIVALGLVLMVPSTVMAGPARVLPTAEDSLPSLSNVLTQAWALVSSLWEKAGCVIDPNGLCVVRPSPTLTSQPAGCGIDPSGSPETLTSQPLDGEAGCGIDPDGRCVK